MSSGFDHTFNGEANLPNDQKWPAASPQHGTANGMPGMPPPAPGQPAPSAGYSASGDGYRNGAPLQTPPLRPQRPRPATPIQRPTGPASLPPMPPVVSHPPPVAPPVAAPDPVEHTPADQAPAQPTPEAPAQPSLGSFLDRFLATKAPPVAPPEAAPEPAPEPEAAHEAAPTPAPAAAPTPEPTHDPAPAGPAPPPAAVEADPAEVNEVPLLWSELPPASAFHVPPPVAPPSTPSVFPPFGTPPLGTPLPSFDLTPLPTQPAAPPEVAPEAAHEVAPEAPPVAPPAEEPEPQAVEKPKAYVNKTLISNGHAVAPPEIFPAPAQPAPAPSPYAPPAAPVGPDPTEALREPEDTSDEPAVPDAWGTLIGSPAQPASIEPDPLPVQAFPEPTVAPPAPEAILEPAPAPEPTVAPPPPEAIMEPAPAPEPTVAPPAPEAILEPVPEVGAEVQQTDFLEDILDEHHAAAPMFVPQDASPAELETAVHEEPVIAAPPAIAEDVAEADPIPAPAPEAEAEEVPEAIAAPEEVPVAEVEVIPEVAPEVAPVAEVEVIPEVAPEAAPVAEVEMEPAVAPAPEVQEAPAPEPQPAPVVLAPMPPVAEAPPLEVEAAEVITLLDTPPLPPIASPDVPVLPAVAETGPPLEELVRDRVASRLLEKKIVTRDHIREAKQAWFRGGEKDTFWRTLADHASVDREKVYAEAASIYAFRHIEITDGKPKPEFVKRVVETFTKTQRNQLFEHRLLPIEYQFSPEPGVNKLVFATHDPTNNETIRFLRELILDHFDLCYAPESQIAELLETLFPPTNEYLDRLQEDEIAMDLGASFEFNQKQLIDEDALDAEINRSGLINLFEAALVEAVRMEASDIHVFPRAKTTQFHFRVDGELQHWHTQDKVHPEAMLAVVKDRCLNIDRFEREAAQDGFIQRNVDGTTIRYRVSVLPIASSDHGVRSESVVIRVLDDRRVFTDLSRIGLLTGALNRFEKAIKQPQGMVIMTGPTGSGKSTTLVAALHSVVRPQVNVLTVEDPVEYLIKDVRQIKLGHRLNLNQAIRSILRHDPDIVMVGEMRDRDTAELAIKLANTGHLTFSTLHTNDAPSAVSRLYKMGIEPFLIAYAINLVVAQRLLRTLCPECKVIDTDPDRVLLRELGFTEEEQETTTFYKAAHLETCKTCRGVGYRGRRAISEALYFSRAIRHIIVEAGDTIDEDAIRTKAVEEGMLTLLASAREVVKNEETSVEEVIRVTASED